MNLLSLHQIHCPYCGEQIDIVVDCSEPSQSYIEDCQVCCRPIGIEVEVDADGEVGLEVRHENDC